MNANQVALKQLSSNQAFEFYGIRYHVVATEYQGKSTHYTVNNHATGQLEAMHIDQAVTPIS